MVLGQSGSGLGRESLGRLAFPAWIDEGTASSLMGFSCLSNLWNRDCQDRPAREGKR